MIVLELSYRALHAQAVANNATISPVPQVINNQSKPNSPWTSSTPGTPTTREPAPPLDPIQTYAHPICSQRRASLWPGTLAPHPYPCLPSRSCSNFLGHAAIPRTASKGTRSPTWNGGRISSASPVIPWGLHMYTQYHI